MRTGKPVSSKSISDRRGTSAATAASATGSSGIAFDFGDGTGAGGSYSKTSGILSSVGRLGLLVLGGALVLVVVLLRQDNAVASEGAAAAVRGAVDANRSAAGSAKTAASTTTTTTTTASTAAAPTSDYITLQTPHGNIRIVLRPDLSPESAHYVRSLIQSHTCTAQSCRLYRAEKPGILQGILKSGADADPSVAVQPNTVFGRCPEEYRDVEQDCPEHDPNCGCHGPIMVKGDVGWAGGSAGGPDFFINTYEHPAKHWGNQHTVWGSVEDDASLATIAKYWGLPVRNNGGMHLLMEEVPFQVVASGKISRMLDSIRSMLH